MSIVVIHPGHTTRKGLGRSSSEKVYSNELHLLRIMPVIRIYKVLTSDQIEEPVPPTYFLFIRRRSHSYTGRLGVKPEMGKGDIERSGNMGG